MHRILLSLVFLAGLALPSQVALAAAAKTSKPKSPKLTTPAVRPMIFSEDQPRAQPIYVDPKVPLAERFKTLVIFSNIQSKKDPVTQDGETIEVQQRSMTPDPVAKPAKPSKNKSKKPPAEN